MHRSWLFAPGDDPAKMAKAAASGVDAVILDLEDSVSAAHKADARAKVAAFLAERRPVTPALWVRMNPLASEIAQADLDAVIPAAPAGVVLPKCEGGADVARLSNHLARLEAAAGIEPGSIRILPIATETPKSLFQLGSYTATADRLAGLTWGAEDLSAAVGASTARTEDGGWTDLPRLARALCLAGAAAAEVAPIETVYTAFRDLDGLAAYAAAGRRDGFTGMLAIHPAQVEVINAAFTPTKAELDHARRIVALFAERPDAGVLSLDGEMLDLPHLKRAQRTLALGAASH